MSKDKRSFDGTNAADIFFKSPLSATEKKDEYKHTYNHTDKQPKETRSRKMNLLFTPSLYATTKERAELIGISINELVSTAVEQYLS